MALFKALSDLKGLGFLIVFPVSDLEKVFYSPRSDLLILKPEEEVLHFLTISTRIGLM